MEFLQGNWLYISVSIAIIGLLIAIIASLVKIGIWVGSTDAKIESLQEGLRTVQEGLRTVQEGLRTVQEDVKKLFERLPPPKAADALSPLHLTEFGLSISESVDAKNWAKSNAHNLMDRAKDKEEFEIFNACSDYVNEKFEHDERFSRTVQSAAYDYGTESEQVLVVYRIELRDSVLAKLYN